MISASKIRHSAVGRYVRRSMHLLFRLRHPGDNPVRDRLPGGIDIHLYPQGQVAEFLAFQRFFERTELALVRACLKPGMKVVDVGANIGLYSVLAAKLVGPTGAVWAFEPSPDTFSALQRNLSLNRCDHVRAFQLALSDTPDATLPLRTDQGYGDAYRYLVQSSTAKPPDGADTTLVPVTTLDQWGASAGLRDIDFLKVDIEGGEYRLLLGAVDILKSSPDVTILFECEADWCARSGCRQEDSMDLLGSLGFKLCAWHARSRKWVSDKKTLLNAGMLWACRDPQRLPQLPPN